MSIKNIVATAALRYELDLKEVENKCASVLCHHVNAFGSVNLQYEKGGVLQLFGSGRIVVIGGCTEGQNKRIFLKFIRILVDLGLNVEYINYKIQNIVACYRFRKPVKLAKIAAQYKLEFEPELFPAVRYRNDCLKVTVNIFHTGSCVILGAKTTEIVSEVICEVKELLENAEN